MLLSAISFTELCAKRSCSHAYRHFSESSEGESFHIDVSKYEPVYLTTIALQLPRFLLIIAALKLRVIRRVIYGSETIILTLESILPTQLDGERTIQKIWMLTTLISLIFFCVDLAPCFILSALSLIAILLNLYFVHMAEGSFWLDLLLGLMWLSVSTIVMNFFKSKYDEQSRPTEDNQGAFEVKSNVNS